MVWNIFVFFESLVRTEGERATEERRREREERRRGGELATLWQRRTGRGEERKVVSHNTVCSVAIASLQPLPSFLPCFNPS